MRFRKVIYVCHDGIIVCKCTTRTLGSKYDYIDPKEIIEMLTIKSDVGSFDLYLADRTNVIDVTNRSVKTQLQILTNRIEKENNYDKKFN